MENLENILESILFYSGDAVEKSLIKEKLEIKDSELNKAIKVLEEKYSGACGIKLLQFNNKIQFATNSTYSESVDIVLKKTRERALSKTIIETAAIIAYKQPITRVEIETIRGGAQADYALKALLEHKLIEVVGRKETLGRPLLFGTTDEFLKRFNLSSLDELPDYDELMSQVKELNQIGQSATNLYKEYDVPDGEIISEENIADRIKENKQDIEDIKKQVEEDMLSVDFAKQNENNVAQTSEVVEETPENIEEQDDTEEEQITDINEEEKEEYDYDDEEYSSSYDEEDEEPSYDEESEETVDFADNDEEDDYIISTDIKQFKKH